MHSLSLRVNGRTYQHEVDDRQLLVYHLRESLGLTGTHVGCVIGECGACSVLVDGELVKSCLLLAVQADGCDVTTVEGLGEPDALTVVQSAFVEEYGLQCGYCTPGMVLAAPRAARGATGPDRGGGSAKRLRAISVCAQATCRSYRQCSARPGSSGRPLRSSPAHPRGVRHEHQTALRPRRATGVPPRRSENAQQGGAALRARHGSVRRRPPPAGDAARGNRTEPTRSRTDSSGRTLPKRPRCQAWSAS